METNKKEVGRLESISANHDYNDGFNGILMDYKFKSIQGLIKKNHSVLELGPADGKITKMICGITNKITVVDASSTYLSKIKEYDSNIESIVGLIEEVEIEKKFNLVLLMHVLEHVEDPIQILKRCKEWLTSDGQLIITVPNANSFHRLLGVNMGLLEEVYQLNKSDIDVGHRRVYDWHSLELDVVNSGLKVVQKQGIFFKLFNNSMMLGLKDEQLDGLFELGNQFPENCAEIMFVCRLGGE